MVSDQLPVVLAISVVAQTRPRVGRGPDLPLLVDGRRESLPEDGLDIIISVVAFVWSRNSFRL